MKFAVAIDGPSGAGKSTIAKELAKRLNLTYVDTGALYRCIGLYFLRTGVDLGDPEEVARGLSEISVDLGYGPTGQEVFLSGENVTREIRRQEVSQMASRASVLEPVRAFLFQMQVDMARIHDVIMDGRDIGTVVLPEARVKIFLTASPEERARRRCAQLAAQGEPAEFQAVLSEIEQRDRRDQNRAVAPLRAAEDAVVVDSTGEAPEETLERLAALIRARR